MCCYYFLNISMPFVASPHIPQSAKCGFSSYLIPDTMVQDGPDLHGIIHSPDSYTQHASSHNYAVSPIIAIFNPWIDHNNYDTSAMLLSQSKELDRLKLDFIILGYCG